MTETTIWDIEEHRREPVGIRNFSFRESFDHLADYLDGYNIREPRTFDPENGGNPLMVRSGDGFYVGGSLNMLRDDPDSPLFGCEIQNIRDEDGHLFITGNRDGGTVGVEVRQLTKAGEPRLDDLTEATYRPPYWVDPEIRHSPPHTPCTTVCSPCGTIPRWRSRRSTRPTPPTCRKRVPALSAA